MTLIGHTLKGGAWVISAVTLIACASANTVESVSSNLNRSSELKTRKFQVEFEEENDVVTIRGIADTRNTRDLIVSLVQGTPGVDKVIPDIKVLGDEYTAATDARMALERITRRLERSGLHESSKVDITLKNGVATLSGATQVSEQNAHIEGLVLEDPYVTKVVNTIQIGSLRPDPAIEQDIRSALSRNNIPASSVQFEVRDGMVTADGNESSFEAVDEILSTILNVDGVIGVESNIKVSGHPYPIKQFRS